MKRLFFVIFAILAVSSVFTYKTLPGAIGDRPVIYWVTDANPARTEQVRTFKRWLKAKYPDAPDIEVRVDTANMSPEKTLVQGVSGVCGDLIDHTGGSRMRFLNSVGMLEDLQDEGLKRGFDISKTFTSITPDLTNPVKIEQPDGTHQYENHQFAFPCNIFSEMLWVNSAAFTELGVEVPSRRWTWDDFERIGKEFVTRANPPGESQKIFFAPDIRAIIVANTDGGSMFNETGTEPTFNTPQMINALKLVYKWTHESPRLIPTSSEKNSFSATAGYGGAGLSRFTEGKYALIAGGRYFVILFRVINDERRAAGLPPLKFDVSEMPHFKMPVAFSGTRATAVYAAGKHKDLAMYFMEFLASPDYNMNIVNDGDSIPPNPEFVETEEYKRPAGREEEWGTHEAFSDALRDIALTAEFSPFILDDVVGRLFNRAQQNHINGRSTAEDALAALDVDVRAEMKRSLEENPDLVPLYEDRMATQKKIDELRAKGEKVPISWITNPYHKKWYQFNGWADMEK